MHCSAPAQFWHAPPSRPHAKSWLPAPQNAPAVPVKQHPAQVVESHTHVPARQRVPAWHCGPAPQAQFPNAEHVSARVMSHAMQFVPFGPQAVTVRTVWHTPFWQQPCGHVWALQLVHCPFVHWPALPQLAHAMPPRPHCIAVCCAAVTHTFPLQQPAQLN